MIFHVPTRLDAQALRLHPAFGQQVTRKIDVLHTFPCGILQLQPLENVGHYANLCQLSTLSTAKLSATPTKPVGTSAEDFLRWSSEHCVINFFMWWQAMTWRHARTWPSADHLTMLLWVRNVETRLSDSAPDVSWSRPQWKSTWWEFAQTSCARCFWHVRICLDHGWQCWIQARTASRLSALSQVSLADANVLGPHTIMCLEQRLEVVISEAPISAKRRNPVEAFETND